MYLYNTCCRIGIISYNTAISKMKVTSKTPDNPKYYPIDSENRCFHLHSFSCKMLRLFQTLASLTPN